MGRSVVDLDLFVSGSVFRDGTNYPPKSNVRTLLRQSSSQRQPGQTSSSLFLYFPYLYLRPGSWFRYIVYSYIIYNYPYLLARVLFWSQPERQQFNRNVFLNISTEQTWDRHCFFSTRTCHVEGCHAVVKRLDKHLKNVHKLVGGTTEYAASLNAKNR